MESLQEILSQKNFLPPDETLALKDYIKRRYKSNCEVTVNRGDFTVAVPNSSLAGMLQMEKLKIMKACGIKGKLFIRTGR